MKKRVVIHSAIESMKRGLACGDPNRAQVLNHFGELYLSMGRVKEAEDCFAKAQKENPRWVYSYVNQATLVLQTQQDYLGAGKLLKKAMTIDKTCVSVYLQMAQLHMLCQEMEEATEMLDKGLQEARTENDMQQVFAMKETMTYQRAAMDKYQDSLKTE